MSENAKRYEAENRRSASKKRNDRRRREKKALESLNRAAKIVRQAGCRVLSLDDGELGNVRDAWGYSSNKGYLKSLLNGTTLAESVGELRTITSQHMDHMQVIREVQNLLRDERIASREEAFYKKIGPYYLTDYELWASKVQGVYARKVIPAENEHREVLDKAIAKVASKYMDAVREGTQDGHLRALSVDASLHRLNTDASTGHPFYTSNWTRKYPVPGEDGELIDITPREWARSVSRRMIETGDYSDLFDMPYTLFTRKAPRGLNPNDQKINERPVQCSPCVERVIGAGVQQPLVAVMKNRRFSWGLRGVQEMTGLMTEALRNHDTAFEADYSNFDASVSPRLLSRIMLEVIKPLFAEEDHARIEALCHYYRVAKLWAPEGIIEPETVYDGPGILSGSMLTNVLGTMVNEVALEYIFERIRTERKVDIGNEATCFGYGDDLAIFVSLKGLQYRPCNLVDDFAKYAAEVGLTAHPDKQQICSGSDKEMSFLGMVFYESDLKEFDQVKPVYPINRLMPKMLWYEHFGSVGDSGDNFVDYTKDVEEELSLWEKNLAGIIGRLDVAVNNRSFQTVVPYFMEAFHIRVRDCAKFLPDPSVSPTLSLIAQYESEFGECPPSPYLINKEESKEPMCADEEDYLDQLIELAKQTVEGRALLRQWKRKLGTLPKPRVEAFEHVEETVEPLSADSPETPAKQKVQSKVERDGLTPWSDEEDARFRACLAMAKPGKKRELLESLRSLFSPTEYKGDNASPGGDDNGTMNLSSESASS